MRTVGGEGLLSKPRETHLRAEEGTRKTERMVKGNTRSSSSDLPAPFSCFSFSLMPSGYLHRSVCFLIFVPCDGADFCKGNPMLPLSSLIKAGKCPMAMAGGPANPHWELKALQRNSLPLKEAGNCQSCCTFPEHSWLPRSCPSGQALPYNSSQPGPSWPHTLRGLSGTLHPRSVFLSRPLSPLPQPGELGLSCLPAHFSGSPWPLSIPVSQQAHSPTPHPPSLPHILAQHSVFL